MSYREKEGTKIPMIDLSTKIDEIIFSIIDLETTGFNPQKGDKICEIALMKVKNFNEIFRYQTLINPGISISSESSFVNGITDDMVQDSPFFRDITNDLTEMTMGTVLVFHNAVFDTGFINFEMGKSGKQPFENQIVDTLILSRKFFEFPSNSLGNIARFLKIKHENLHRALGDVIVTHHILNYLLKELIIKEKIVILDDLLRAQGISFQYTDHCIEEIPPDLVKAILNKTAVKIRYITKLGEESVRIVKPIEITEFRQSLYLIANCSEKNEQRTFKLNRIKNIDTKF
ncbi:exonuclease domain-containing protein [Elusimicrobiota bacterium]